MIADDMTGTGWQKQWRDMSGRPLAVAILICVCFGLLSMVLGPDNNWDLRFYHLYAPWAYLHDRYTYDIGPAQLQGYLNPTPDFLFYGLISTPLNDFPRGIAFIMGAVHGVNAVLVLAIARHVIRPAHETVRWTLQLMAFLIGVTGAGFISLIGLTTGDLLNSIFVLSALLAILKIRDSEIASSATPRFAWAGLLAGIALGLKYTAAIFMPGLGLMAILAAIHRRSLLGGVTFGVMLLAGVLLTAGHHMFALWERFGNPFFPSLNNIFQAPAYDLVSLRDLQFLPKSLLQAITYPFYWMARNSHAVSELPFREWRGAIAYVAIIMWCAAFLTDYVCSGKVARIRSNTRGVDLVILFVVVSYFAWVLGFAVYRYAVTLEMLTGVAIVGVVASVVKQNALRLAIAAALFLVATATTQYLDWGRGFHASRGIRPAPYADRYIDIRVPSLPKHSIVLIASGQPTSYFIPYAEPTARYLGVENNFLKLSQNNKLVAEIKRIMQTAGPQKFIISVGKFDAVKLNNILRHFDLKLGSAPCRPIVSNLEEHPLSVCSTTPI